MIDKLFFPGEYPIDRRQNILRKTRFIVSKKPGFSISREELEQWLCMRTDELLIANRKLELEICERKRIEDILRLSEESQIILKEKIRLLASELSLAEERERKRIIAELHDSVIQTLVFSKFKIESFVKSLSKENVDKLLQEIHDLVKKSIQDLRTLIFDTTPPLLYEAGLESTLEVLTGQMQQRYNISFFFEDDKKEKPLSDDLKVFLYQAVRESLFNIVKHARTDRGHVTVKREFTTVNITIEDNGAGFDISKIHGEFQKNNCFGLFNIKERLNYFGGEIDIDSGVGRGTKLIITAPLSSSGALT